LDWLFDYYLHKGDVQMCVSMLLTLRKPFNLSYPYEQVWITSYLDILYRLDLCQQATFIASLSPVDLSKRYSPMDTDLSLGCPDCKLMLWSDRSPNERFLCQCQKTNKCALCHFPVRELTAWCQGCGHGGHLEHMQAWFAAETLCPTGCGHQCQ